MTELLSPNNSAADQGGFQRCDQAAPVLSEPMAVNSITECEDTASKAITSYDNREAAQDVQSSAVTAVKPHVTDAVEWVKENPKKTAAVTCGLVGAVLLGPAVPVTALNAAGFTSAGVKAGSLASIAESVIYGANACGAFSVLQHYGATVTAPAAVKIIGGVVATGTSIAVAASSKLKSGSKPGDKE